MTTSTLIRPDVSSDTESELNSEIPKFFHYVKKDKIAESAVLGTIVEALCGERFSVTKAPKPNSPVCPKCKEIYAALRPGEN